MSQSAAFFNFFQRLPESHLETFLNFINYDNKKVSEENRSRFKEFGQFNSLEDNKAQYAHVTRF